MKKQIKLLLTLLMFAVSSTYAQFQTPNDLTIVPVSENNTVHFISPEPIQYVDISTNNFVGDIPVDNILRIKYLPESKDSIDNQRLESAGSEDAIVTVVGESFYAQYNLVYREGAHKYNGITSIEILPQDIRALEFPEITMTRPEMRHYSMEVLKRKRSYYNVAAKENGMLVHLNNIFAFGDYVFVDVSFKNKTNIKYDVDEFRFTIKDKRITKATNVQDIEIKPEFTLYDQSYFRKNYRNVFVFKKFTYPNDKVLSLRVTEDQISGRTVELKIDYRDLLNADTL